MENNLVFCNPKVVAIFNDKKKIQPTRIKLGLLVSEVNDSATLLTFNSELNIQKNIIKQSQPQIVKFKTLPQENIFKLDNYIKQYCKKNGQSNEKITYTLNRWIKRYEKEIYRIISSKCHDSRIEKCIEMFDEFFFDGNQQFCDAKRQVISIPKQTKTSKKHHYHDFIPNFNIDFSNDIDLYPKNIPKPRNIDWNKKTKYKPINFTFKNTQHPNIPNHRNPAANNCLSSRKPWADPVDINDIPFTSKEINNKVSWKHSKCRDSVLTTPIKDRDSFMGKIKFQGRYPLNPSGRTGIQGKGTLPRWSTNKCVSLVPIFYNNKQKQWFLELGLYHSKYVIPAHLVLKNVSNHESIVKLLKIIMLNILSNISQHDLTSCITEDMVKKLPGKIHRHNKIPNKYNTRESINSYLTLEKIVDLMLNNSHLVNEIYQGYWNDPRNTDNAWMENTVYTITIPKKPINIPYKLWKAFLKLYFISLNTRKHVNLYSYEFIQDNLQNTYNPEVIGIVIEKIYQENLKINNKKQDNKIKHYKNLLTNISETEKTYDNIKNQSEKLVYLEKHLEKQIQDIKKYTKSLKKHNDISNDNINCLLDCKEKSKDNLFMKHSLCQ